MLFRKPPTVPDDLRDIDATLRRLRPELPAERAELIARQARMRARASIWSETANHKEPSLRSRLAIIFMLVLGFAFSGVGVGLAVTGVTAQDVDSSQAQYPSEEPQVGGETDEDLGGGPAAPGDDVDEDRPPVVPDTDVAGETDETPAAPVAGETDETPAAPVAGETDVVQENRQLGVQETGSLPFTGFAAIPVLLLGMVLLTAGFVLRRRSGDSL